MMLSLDTPVASAAESSRVATNSRQVVVMSAFSNTIAGPVTKYCHTSTVFENPASRGTCPKLLNSH